MGSGFSEVIGILQPFNYVADVMASHSATKWY